MKEINWIDWVNLFIASIGAFFGIWFYVWRKRFDEDNRRSNDMPYFKIKESKIPETAGRQDFFDYDIILENGGGDCFYLDAEIVEEGPMIILKTLDQNTGIIGKGDSVTIHITVDILKVAKSKENVVYFNLLLGDKRGNSYVQKVEAHNIGRIQNERKVNVHPPKFKKK